MKTMHKRYRLKVIVLICVCFVLLLSSAQTVFGEDPSDRAREALGNDLLKLAKRAQEYYRRPINENGGGGSFNGLWADATGMSRLCIPNTNWSSVNGIFAITTTGTATTLGLTGWSPFMETNGSSITISVEVFPDSVHVQYTN
jgi:hypothetical protein